LKEKDSTSKTVGIICILLTVVSIAATIMLTGSIMNMINTQVGSQLQQMQAVPGF
jgi:hypothetical protein